MQSKIINREDNAKDRRFPQAMIYSNGDFVKVVYFLSEFQGIILFTNYPKETVGDVDTFASCFSAIWKPFHGTIELTF